jgi:transcriptional regulator with XRE-family HTH domain
MKTTKWDDFIKERHSDEEIATAKREAMKELKLLDLQRLRKLSGQTQAQVAEKLHVTQAEFSRVERRPNLTLATLQKVVEALGGKLRISAQFEDVSYALKGAWTENEIPAPEVIDAHQKRKSVGRRSRTVR